MGFADFTTWTMTSSPRKRFCIFTALRQPSPSKKFKMRLRLKPLTFSSEQGARIKNGHDTRSPKTLSDDAIACDEKIQVEYSPRKHFVVFQLKNACTSLRDLELEKAEVNKDPHSAKRCSLFYTTAS
jgi:hypothetical protein